jgi:prepilin-type N-terminal cleavage/methylation domain-containing protein
MRSTTRNGFTLAELMIVVSVIAILIALLLPALNKAKFATRLAVCSSNLRQIAIAHTTYASDEWGWYPYPATEQRLTSHGLKWMLPTGLAPESTPMLAPYISGETLDPRENKLMQCPQAVADLGEVLSNHSKDYYAFLANRINAQGSNQSAYYDTNSQGNWQRTWQYVKDESLLLRKPNETMWFNGYRNNWGWSTVNGEYTILAMDHTTRWFGTTTAYTNHVAAGDGEINGTRIQWYDGTATVNYAFTDGSVKPFQFPVTNFRDTASMGAGTEGGASTVIFPKAWAQ